MNAQLRGRILGALEKFEESMAYSSPEMVPEHMAELRLKIESALPVTVKAERTVSQQERLFTKDEELRMFALDRALSPYRELIRFTTDADNEETQSAKLRNTVVTDANAYYRFLKNGPWLDVTSLDATSIEYVSTEEED